MKKELLIEIGVEELPAIPFLKEAENLKAKWQSVLSENNLQSECEFYYTPRRIVFYHPEFLTIQPDGFSEFIGAPKQVALKDGEFTQAALSFAKKCEIEPSELKFETINGKEVLYHKKLIKGRASRELLGDMIEKFLLSLNFGKSMRWGEGKFEFIRPIRSFLCLLGDEVVEFSKFDVASSNTIYQHRSVSYDKFVVKNASDYFGCMDKIGVILSQNLRRERILNQFRALEQKNAFSIEIDEALLDEVVAITEYPNALVGEFEERFLDVPSEVIITSMKENQRYFPVFKDGRLSNRFVVVSNAICDDYSLIVRGNEKVLRARLSDAMFFWQSDLAAEFSPEKLKNITYLKELGSTYDKELRELKVAFELAGLYKDRLNLEVGSEYQDLLQRAIMLSKADLTTQMVYEFPELQGVMGGYYARAKGESEFVSRAISQQYLPSGENSDSPSGIFSSVVAMSAKIDTLMGLFSVGKIPSGNKDPYALRRCANGIIKIVLEQKIKFDVREILAKLATNYAKFDLKTLENFILDRLYTFFDLNPSIIKSCLLSGNSEILAQCEAIEALGKISVASDFRENFSTFKRLANIIKDEKIGLVDESLFEIGAEGELFSKFNEAISGKADLSERLNALFGLKGVIDNFFDKVMINAEDEAIRKNRIALIGQIYKEFLKIADIKEISL